MVMDLPIELIHIIESYSRKIQPTILLEDIIDYDTSLKKIEYMYNQVIYKKYLCDHMSMIGNKISWYNEFLKGLSLIGAINMSNYKYTKMDLRLIWAKYSPYYRSKIYDILKNNIKLHTNRRPGDPILNPIHLAQMSTL